MAVDWDDLNTACMEAFGNAPVDGTPIAITYQPMNGAPFPVVAIFDRASLDMLPLGGAGGQEARQTGAAGNVTIRRPVLGVQTSQFPADPDQGDGVLVGNDAYYVKEARLDGHGWALLLLSKTRT